MRGTFTPDIPCIAAELERAGITLIEDCAQAWGVPAAGTYGRAAVFSTQQWKLIATGEGGLVVTDDVELVTTMRAMSGDTQVRLEGPRWRSNVRMPEITAALALPQRGGVLASRRRGPAPGRRLARTGQRVNDRPLPLCERARALSPNG